MADQSNGFPIETPLIATPGTDPRAWTLAANIVPPNFPAGCEIWLMRPGDLMPVVKIDAVHAPVGCMIGIAPPALAEHFRQAIGAELARIRAAQEKKADEVGRRGR